MSEADDEQLLRENLHMPALSPEALARIRRATEAEWRAQVGAPRARWIPLASAAAFVLVGLVATLQFWPRGPAAATGDPLAELARTENPGVIEEHAFWRDRPVAVGSALRAGNDFTVQGASLLALNGGGNVRLARGAQFEVLSANSVRLTSGEMYVDIPPGQHALQSFVAITDAGEFRHVGTQFAISVLDGATRLRVREGSVQWRAADGETLVPAGTEVLIDKHHVTRSNVEPTGAHWSWTETLAPDIDIENRPLGEFLDWVARETGRTLVIADEQTRRQVATIRMHGNVHGLAPLQALKAVMASTSLSFDLPAGAIRVSFAGASQASLQ